MTGGTIEIEGYEDAVLVGRGGFAAVYRAFQPKFNRTVAIKVLDVRPDERLLKRFEQECKTLGNLSGHPHIVTIFDSGLTTSGEPYLTMLYMPAGSLAERIHNEGPLPPADVVSTGIKLASALEVAHNAGILHRDVKPENVLVTQYGEPQLADFGLARFEGPMSSHTGTFSATLAHAAPELINGDRASVASDLYSFGSMLFTLTSGSPAFVRDGDEGIIPLVSRIASDPVPDLTTLGSPPGLAGVINRAMAKRPEDRYASAAELITALRAVEAEAGTARTVAPTRLQAAVPTAHELPIPTVPASTIDAPARHTPVPEPEPARRRWHLVITVTLAVLAFGAMAAIGAVFVRRNRDTTLKSAGTTVPGRFDNPAEAVKDITSQGFTAISDRGPYRTDHVLRVMVGTAVGYEHYEHAFFYTSTKFVGLDTPSKSISNRIGIGTQTDDTIALIYYMFRRTDDINGPTGGSVVVRFHWDGTQLRPLDAIPTGDSGADLSRR